MITMNDMETSGLHIEAYRKIKQNLLSRSALHEPISEAQIASKLGLSRTPVREALRLLEREGLVTFRPRVGWKLSLLTEDDIDEIFELKLLLEPAAAANAARNASPADRQRLLTIVDQMAAAVHQGDNDRWLNLDVEFHQVLLTISGNRRLRQVIDNLNDQWWRINVGVLALKMRTEQSYKEHVAIAQAIDAGNAEKARQEITEHLLIVKQSLLAALENVFALQKEV